MKIHYIVNITLNICRYNIKKYLEYLYYIYKSNIYHIIIDKIDNTKDRILYSENEVFEHEYIDNIKFYILRKYKICKKYLLETSIEMTEEDKDIKNIVNELYKLQSKYINFFIEKLNEMFNERINTLKKEICNHILSIKNYEIIHKINDIEKKLEEIQDSNLEPLINNQTNQLTCMKYNYIVPNIEKYIHCYIIYYVDNKILGFRFSYDKLNTIFYVNNSKHIFNSMKIIKNRILDELKLFDNIKCEIHIFNNDIIRDDLNKYLRDTNIVISRKIQLENLNGFNDYYMQKHLHSVNLFILYNEINDFILNNIK